MLSVQKPPKKEATETFWRNILENDREHNQISRVDKEGGAEIC